MWLFSPLPKPVLAWVDGWCTDRHTGWERVGTDLFLLNSSRFNQQIIDLIKWHPLLGQEPARSMRISQAKIKISTHSHNVHALPLTSTSLSARLEAEVIPHTLPSHQKQIQAEVERQDQGAEPECKTKHKQPVYSESKNKKAKAPKPERITGSTGLFFALKSGSKYICLSYVKSDILFRLHSHLIVRYTRFVWGPKYYGGFC